MKSSCVPDPRAGWDRSRQSSCVPDPRAGWDTGATCPFQATSLARVRGEVVNDLTLVLTTGLFLML